MEPEEAVFRYDMAPSLWEGVQGGGGFPKSVNGHSGAVSALVEGLLSEIYRHGKNPRIVQEILSSVLDKTASAFSYKSVAQDLGVSHNTEGIFGVLGRPPSCGHLAL